MPRPTLFPYTTLFRSTVCPSQFATRRTLFHVLVGCGLLMLKVSRYQPEREKARSEERFSRNAETYTLSLHDALPIYSMPIAVRYTQDAFSRSGWLWPVDAKGEPLPTRT